VVFDLEDLGEVLPGLVLVHVVLVVVTDDDLADDVVIETGDEEEAGDVEIELKGLEDFQGNLGEAAVEVVDEEDEAAVLVVECLLDPVFHFLLEIVEEGGVGLGSFLIFVVNVPHCLAVEFDSGGGFGPGDAGKAGGGVSSRPGFYIGENVEEGSTEEFPVALGDVDGAIGKVLRVHAAGLQGSEDNLGNDAAPNVLTLVILPRVEPDGSEVGIFLGGVLVGIEFPAFFRSVPEVELGLEPTHGGGLAGAPVAVKCDGKRRAGAGVAEGVQVDAEALVEIEEVEAFSLLALDGVVTEKGEEGGLTAGREIFRIHIGWLPSGKRGGREG
jgi:hypothetical protein